MVPHSMWLQDQKALPLAGAEGVKFPCVSGNPTVSKPGPHHVPQNVRANFQELVFSLDAGCPLCPGSQLDPHYSIMQRDVLCCLCSL